MKNGSATSTGSVEELNERILHLEKQLKLETARNEHAISLALETGAQLRSLTLITRLWQKLLQTVLKYF